MGRTAIRPAHLGGQPRRLLMATQYQMGEDGARLPEGVVPVHTLYGEPATGVTPAHVAIVAGLAVTPTGVDGIGYEEVPEPPPPVVEDGVIRAVATKPDRAKRCRAKDDTCMGWRINGSDYCAAHAGKLTGPTP